MNVNRARILPIRTASCLTCLHVYPHNKMHAHWLCAHGAGCRRVRLTSICVHSTVYIQSLYCIPVLPWHRTCYSKFLYCYMHLPISIRRLMAVHLWQPHMTAILSQFNSTWKMFLNYVIFILKHFFTFGYVNIMWSSAPYRHYI